MQLRDFTLQLLIFALFLSQPHARAADDAPAQEAFLARIERLEHEQTELLIEIEAEKERLTAQDAVSGETVTAYGYRNFATLDDLERELAKHKDWQWKAGQFTITPYGYLSLVGAWETNRTVPGEYPLYVQPRRGDDVKTGSYFDMKSTRLGLMIRAPEIACLPDIQVTGVFELDFQGAFALENKSGVLMRKAYFELKNEDFLFLVGQTWDVYSPIFPNMLTYVPGIGCGNLGYRRPMIRYDRYWDRGNGRVEWQAAIAASLTANLSAYSGEVWEGRASKYPEFQGRIARTFNKFGPWQLPAAFGVSTMLAEKHYQHGHGDLTRFSWSVNFDMNIRFSDKIYLSGEFFFGELLNSSFGGILQDINPYTLQNVGSTGGWVSLTNDFAPRWHSSVGLCIDDPWSKRLKGGRMRDWNSCAFINLSFDVTKKFLIGAEYTFWATDYTDIGTAYAHCFQILLKYNL